MLDDLHRRLVQGAILAAFVVVGLCVAWLLAGCVSAPQLKDIATSAVVAGVDRAAERLGVPALSPVPTTDPWAAYWAAGAALLYPLIVRPLRLWLAGRGDAAKKAKKT